MKTCLSYLSVVMLCSLGAEETLMHPHEDIRQYSMHGNFQKGLATKEMGAKQFEVWRASIAVGSKTPRHVHETEEVFIVLKGKILAIVGDQEIECTAPATLICPANVPHQLINIGDEPTDQILVLGIDSKNLFFKEEDFF
jgi:quercetin dioxygenase-like cupin family protein